MQATCFPPEEPSGSVVSSPRPGLRKGSEHVQGSRAVTLQRETDCRTTCQCATAIGRMIQGIARATAQLPLGIGDVLHNGRRLDCSLTSNSPSRAYWPLLGRVFCCPYLPRCPDNRCTCVNSDTAKEVASRKTEAEVQRTDPHLSRTNQAKIPFTNMSARRGSYE